MLQHVKVQIRCIYFEDVTISYVNDKYNLYILTNCWYMLQLPIIRTSLGLELQLKSFTPYFQDVLMVRDPPQPPWTLSRWWISPPGTPRIQV